MSSIVCRESSHGRNFIASVEDCQMQPKRPKSSEENDAQGDVREEVSSRKEGDAREEGEPRMDGSTVSPAEFAAVDNAVAALYVQDQ